MDNQIPYILRPGISCGLKIMVTPHPLVACFLSGHVLHAGATIMRDGDECIVTGKITKFNRWDKVRHVVSIERTVTLAQLACLLGHDYNNDCGCILAHGHYQRSVPRPHVHTRCPKAVRRGK